MAALYPFAFDAVAPTEEVNFNEIFNDEAELGSSLDAPSTFFMEGDALGNLATPTNSSCRPTIGFDMPSFFFSDELDLSLDDAELAKLGLTTEVEGAAGASEEEAFMMMKKNKRARARCEDENDMMEVSSPRKRQQVQIGSVSSPSSSSECDQPQIATVKGSWSPEEDNMLRALVNEMLNRVESEGAISWTMIASRMKIRSAKQCRERWILNLDPKINHEPFTPQEDAILLSACAQLGPRWTKIKTLLPGRTENSVKTRYKSLTRKSNARALQAITALGLNFNQFGTR